MNPIEILRHAGTGETFRILKSTKEEFQMELAFDPHGEVAGAHLHPGRHQTLAVVTGRLACNVDGKEIVLEAGQSVVVPPGTKHFQGNPYDEEVRAIETFRPAGHMHDFFRVFCALAALGHTDAKGAPKLMWAAALFHEYGDSILPAPLTDRVVLKLLAPVAVLLGYHAEIKALASGSPKLAAA